MRDLYDYLWIGIKQNQCHFLEGTREIYEIKKQYVQIVDLIKKRDAEYSLQAMFNHLRFVLDFVKNNKGLVL